MAGQILKITKEGVFADGLPTTTYNGVRIDGLAKFADVLRDGVVEIELMQSDTKGKYGVAGKPAPDADGRYTPGFPIRISTGQSSFPAHRRFSQVITSFIVF